MPGPRAYALCSSTGIRQTEAMEKTAPNSQPIPPSLQNGQAPPLTGKAGALAAVERLYQDHGEELKQLADA